MERPAGHSAAGNTPYDAHGRVGVPDAPGRQYLAIHGHPGDALAIEVAGPDEGGEVRIHGRDGKSAEPIRPRRRIHVPARLGLPRPSATRGGG
jgi:hypothetical protein